MKMKAFLVAGSSLLLCTSAGFAQITQPNPNPIMDGYLADIVADSRVQNAIQKYTDDSDLRFDEHMEITRIASPSRQEYYRAKEIHDRLKTFGFAESELVYTGKNNSGIMPGAAVQQVDGRKVYQTCAIIQGTWNGLTDGTNSIYARPKVVIEGHIDTVNPSEIPGFDPVAKPNAWYYEPIKMQPVWKDNEMVPVVSTAEELRAIPETDELHFDANGKIIKDANYTKALKRYANLGTNSTAWTAEQREAYRLYVPGYSDAMENSIATYHMAKLFKTYNIKPVHDIWFCFTAGEEGRGNLAGMKQLYGYNQDNAATDPADNGKNKLNIVANLSIDGGNGTFNYLGSYRYEVNYKGTHGALEAARRIAEIADVLSPSETGDTNLRTTYTVGIAYKKDDGSTSFEIDMRSPQVPPLNEMKSRLYPKFGVDETTPEGVVIDVLWYGDRPAHVRSDFLIKNDPEIYASWKSRGLAGLSQGNLSTSSSSLNDNVPGAMNIPSVNLNIGTTAAGGGNHAFNEWGIRGSLTTEVNNMKRVLYTLLAVSGLARTDGGEIVPPAYRDKAPGHTNTVWDSEDMWQQ